MIVTVTAMYHWTDDLRVNRTIIGYDTATIRRDMRCHWEKII
jgi:hypothetical protein